jgi:hypothetical protein
VNHVPDPVLAAIDGLGRAILVDDPTTLDQRLRGDFRIRIDCDRTALDAGTASVTFRLEHGTPAPTLRGHGSFVATVVDGVDSRLREWGIEPPDAYTHRSTDDRWQIYAGRAALP